MFDGFLDPTNNFNTDGSSANPPSLDFVLCPGQPAANYCDCDATSDCADHKDDWCGCQEAQECCQLASVSSTHEDVRMTELLQVLKKEQEETMLKMFKKDHKKNKKKFDKLTNDLTTLMEENDKLINEHKSLTKQFTTYKKNTSNNPDEPLSKVNPSDNHDDDLDEATVVSDEEDVR